MLCKNSLCGPTHNPTLPRFARVPPDALVQPEYSNAAIRFLEKEAVEALTTRAVCQAAGVIAPTVYHHFGDKDGLLRVIVARGVAEFMALKRANQQTRDPLADARKGWNG